MEKIYTAKATATGGRSGHVLSEDGTLDADVRPPGAAGKHLNPEILFAGGYAACFDSALNSVIRAEKLQTGTTSITAEVTLGKQDNGAYGLEVTLIADIPGVEKAKAEELINKAHQVCPYSNATRGNVPVTLIVK